MSDIKRYNLERYFSHAYMEEKSNGEYVKYQHYVRNIKVRDNQLDCAVEFCRQYQIEVKQLKERVKELESQISGLEAARFAYSSEFALDEEGIPDKGSIHQNIRNLKADYARLESQLAEEKKEALSAQRDQATTTTLEALNAVLVIALESKDQKLMLRRNHD